VSSEESLAKKVCELINGAGAGGTVFRWERALFEADARIAYLLRQGLYDFAITEDQDLALYGGLAVAFKLGSGNYHRD
jgi:5'-3' exonuclease